MTPKLSTFVLALALTVPMVPAVAGAQDGTQSGASDSSSESDTSTAESADQASESNAGDDESSASNEEATAEETSNEESSESTDGEKAEQADKSGATGEESSGEETSGDSEESKKSEAKQAEYGPGGRKLRKDYPGTDESKEGQMDTKRIEGLEFKEGKKPEEAYEVQIRELETKIGDLKEKVFQSKSRVVLLKETVLGGNLSGSRALIVHTNELGGRFKLQRAMYSLDGNRIYNESRKTGGITNEKEIKIYDGSITAGNHNVSVLLEYQGSGFGVFNYMKGYNFRITSSCQFEAKQGKASVLKVRSVPAGGAFSDVSKKPGIKCELTTTDLSKDDLQADKSDSGPSGEENSSGESGNGQESGGEGATSASN